MERFPFVSLRNLDVGPGDALLAARRVEQKSPAALLEHEWSPNLLHSSFDVPRLRWGSRHIGAFVRRLGAQDFDRSACPPCRPIGCQLNRGHQDSLWCIANGREEDVESTASENKPHVPDSPGVVSTLKRIRADLKGCQGIPGPGQLTKARQSVEVPCVLKHSKVVVSRNGWPHREVEAVSRLRDLRELSVAMLPCPGVRRGRLDRPSLAVGPPSMHPHHDASTDRIDEHLG